MVVGGCYEVRAKGSGDEYAAVYGAAEVGVCCYRVGETGEEDFGQLGVGVVGGGGGGRG